ncbi:peptidoglycan DD-metalloendopeptidase family protein [Sulfurimonas sp. HSL1-2]|uniref:murein hydrolase activator EnvC family protein n=1 Tax=Thiomicrolovo zhangzhouensis TaxID=3131933 RepID=UPI0031F90681
MIRFALLLGLLLTVAVAAKSIDDKIDETSKSLSSFDRNYASVNAKMAKTAKAILKKKRTVLTQQKKIASLESALQGKAATLSGAKEELITLAETQETLEANRKKLRDDLADLMARIISLAMIQEDNNTLSPDTIIGEAVFAALNEQTKAQITKLGNDYRANEAALKQLTEKTARLKTDIASIEQEKRDLQKAKRANETALGDLKTKKGRYKKELQKILAQKSALKQTLAQLHIIQESESQKAAARQEEQRNEALLASKEVPDVRSVGSSYHKAQTRRYRGSKTIAPLDAYTVLKRYGTYTDPIYKIKIFNESVSLQPKTPDAKVKAVFNGKVILAQETPMLENVVIIEHADGLHTIYAHLDQIAPTVSKGKRLKKGSVIGRVNDELMFEVTQKNYHIDPLQVIR